eukprot:TRINITY_DN9091_c0_g1_i1.p1 TRINITY_DN9091_c0_g1~~TRINITY_DN9091_c0_g1_i1.p1  ORF type:complete len:379 (-),score=72.03 TRINITY_DN9091_c0_g1_i1:569-1540(-)
MAAEYGLIGVLSSMKQILEQVPEQSRFACTKQTIDGKTWLHLAIEHGHIEAMKVMEAYIMQTADVKDEDGQTALHKAAGREKNAKWTMCEMLADILGPEHFESVDKEGKAPHHCAVNDNKSTDLGRWLKEQRAKKKDLSIEDSDALLQAADDGSSEKVQQIVNSKSSDVIFSNEYGFNWLHFVAFWGHIDVLKILKNQINDMNSPSIRDNYGKTWLHLAVEHGHIEVLKLLKEYISPDMFSDISEVKDGHGKTWLHLAAFWGRVQELQLLKEYIPKVWPIEDADGNTALAVAEGDTRKHNEDFESRRAEVRRLLEESKHADPQ